MKYSLFEIQPLVDRFQKAQYSLSWAHTLTSEPGDNVKCILDVKFIVSYGAREVNLYD